MEQALADQITLVRTEILESEDLLMARVNQERELALDYFE